MQDSEPIQKILKPTRDARPTWQFGPSVDFPNWSAVTSDKAQDALNDIIIAFGIEKCFADYSRDEDRTRRAVLEFYADRGRAPGTNELAAKTGLQADGIAAILRSLKNRDLVTFDTDTETITGAYPFSSRQTEHRILIGDRSIHAMCAIDALGTGGMFGRDITIESSCRASGAAIRIETADNGTAIKSATPDTAVVWSGIQISDGCAADSLCTVLAFFESEDVFDDWRKKEQPDIPGYLLSLEEGMQVGRGIFEPFLA